MSPRGDRGTWESYKNNLWFDQELGVSVDFSRMGLSQGALDDHRSAITASLEFMEHLEHGGMANPDEDRQVGHYWLRDAGLAPDADTAAEIEECQRRVRAFVNKVHRGLIRPAIPGVDRFRSFLLIGIGGSALGPQFVADALGWAEDAMEPFFLDNTDPGGFDKVLQSMEEKVPQTLAVVVSKSGGTQEVHNAMEEARHFFKKMGVDFAKHAVAITSPGSQLEKQARQEGFLDVFPIWDWVGGRTSVFSAVGLLPAALQGLDIDAFLKGARHMDRRTRAQDLESNPAARMAVSWFEAGGGTGSRDLVILPYKDRLLLLGRYLQQLVMESLGKKTDLAGNVVHQGLSVYGNKGSTDQHALIQQLREGPDNFFVTFVEVLSDRAGKSIPVQSGLTAGDYLQGFLLGTREALTESGRRSLTITLPEVSAYALGMMIALFERTVGIYAHRIGINAYHQPGVEAGKRAAGLYVDILKRALNRLKEMEGDSRTAESLAGDLGVPEHTEALFRLLEHAAANPDHHVIRTSGDAPWDAAYAYQGAKAKARA